MQEGLDALSEVIHHLETFDVTTVRAATPMYLMARRIRTLGVKMVLSGEGADEIFGGYLYFHRAPGPRAFHEETVRKLDRLHQFDCLAREQGDGRVGRRGPRSLPRQGVPGRGHVDRPGGPSVACSTPEALAWDDELSRTVDPSGRAVAGVHRAPY